MLFSFFLVVQDDIGPMSKKVLEVPYNPPRPLKHYIDFYNIPAEKIKNQEDYFMAKEIHHNSILGMISLFPFFLLILDETH